MKASARRRRFLVEAAVTLVAARLSLRLVPAACVLGWADRKIRVNRFAGDQIAWVLWAIDTISGWRLLRAADLPRALAVHMMLRRRGVASQLCLGVVRENEALVPHSWVEVDREVVAGETPAASVARLAALGGARS